MIKSREKNKTQNSVKEKKNDIMEQGLDHEPCLLLFWLANFRSTCPPRLVSVTHAFSSRKRYNKPRVQISNWGIYHRSNSGLPLEHA